MLLRDCERVVIAFQRMTSVDRHVPVLEPRLDLVLRQGEGVRDGDPSRPWHVLVVVVLLEVVKFEGIDYSNRVPSPVWQPVRR